MFSVMGRDDRNLSGDDAPAALDAIDRALLAMLQDDAKRPLAVLGEAVDLAPSSVAERVRRLEESGVIRGYHALVDPRRVGLDLAAFIGVSLNYPKHIEVFEREALSMPEVQECHHVTGAHSLLLKVRAKNTAAMERVLSRLRGIDGVLRTETMVVFSTRIERPQVPVRDETDGPRAAPRRAAAAQRTQTHAAIPRAPEKKKRAKRG
jgi:Lrp/AsnC family leucine-responsive transcriptional regulator